MRSEEGARRFTLPPGAQNAILKVLPAEDGVPLYRYHFTRRSKSDRPFRHYEYLHSPCAAHSRPDSRTPARDCGFILVSGWTEVVDRIVELVYLGGRDGFDGAISPRPGTRKREGAISTLGRETDHSIAQIRWLREPGPRNETACKLA